MNSYIEFQYLDQWLMDDDLCVCAILIHSINTSVAGTNQPFQALYSDAFRLGARVDRVTHIIRVYTSDSC